MGSIDRARSIDNCKLAPKEERSKKCERAALCVTTLKDSSTEMSGACKASSEATPEGEDAIERDITVPKRLASIIESKRFSVDIGVSLLTVLLHEGSSRPKRDQEGREEEAGREKGMHTEGEVAPIGEARPAA